jgi:protoporphyrinogen oxidase
MAADAHDAIVVGAGLAGLTATRILHRLGYDVVLLEQHERVGGRIRTDLIDGFLLDHGFQLLNPAYPAARRTFDLGALALQPFARGVEVVRDDQQWLLADPRSAPAVAARMVGRALRGRPAPWWELAAFGAYAGACATEPVARLKARPDMSLVQALLRWGVGQRTIDRVVGPFLSGVFADTALQTSRRYADLVLRSFLRGVPAVPDQGMQALPEQIAADLPESVLRTGVTVDRVREGEVSTAEGPVSGRVIIVATEAPTAARLVLGLRVPAMAALTTWYYAGGDAVGDGAGYLHIDGSGSPMLCNVAVMTQAAPGYSASGRPLVAATAVGHHPDAAAAAAARTECARLLGIAAHALEAVACYPVAHALPRFLPGDRLQHDPVVADRLLVIGDHRTTPSIQGALVSGERGALAAARALGPVPR